jgi:hypothetical protein
MRRNDSLLLLLLLLLGMLMDLLILLVMKGLGGSVLEHSLAAVVAAGAPGVVEGLAQGRPAWV